jgi:hypothetical protein
MSGGIPQKVLKKIFPEKIEKGLASDKVYSISDGDPSGIKKGELAAVKFVKTFDVNESAVSSISSIEKDGLIITRQKDRVV